jgi:hypothetical protein
MGAGKQQAGGNHSQNEFYIWRFICGVKAFCLDLDSSKFQPVTGQFHQPLNTLSTGR